MTTSPRRLLAAVSRRLLAALTLAALVAAPAITPASAHHDGEIVEKNGVRVSHAYTEPTAAAAHGIHVYLTIENTGGAADRLVAASVPFANAARIEANVVGDDGTLSVREVPALAVSAGQTLVLQPGSVRLVFDDVSKALEPGELFSMTLTFETAGEITVVAEVEHGEEDETHAEGDHHHDDHEDEPGS